MSEIYQKLSRQVNRCQVCVTSVGCIWVCVDLEKFPNFISFLLKGQFGLFTLKGHFRLILIKLDIFTFQVFNLISQRKWRRILALQNAFINPILNSTLFTDLLENAGSNNRKWKSEKESEAGIRIGKVTKRLTSGVLDLEIT